jgi:uncharacterized OsmC-like protein
LVLAVLLSACQPIVLEPAADAAQSAPPEAAQETTSEGPQTASEGPQLATAKASAQLSNQPGRAIVSARGNHFIVDSVPPLEGPNEELNPLDMMLGALATCGIFVAEKAAQELDVPLIGATATVEGDFDPSGVKTGQTDPRIQAFRVHLDLPGADDEQAAALTDNFTRRCPIYTTVSRAAPVEITTGDQVPSAKADVALATAMVSAQLSNQPGRAIVTARGNHFVIDSVPPLEGPNEERNPLDLMLGALATCGSFVYEKAAQDEGFPLSGLTASVEADFDPSGVKTGQSDPRIQAIRVHMQLEGVDEAQAEMMAEQFQQRCPIYTTLSRAAPIEITTGL